VTTSPVIDAHQHVGAPPALHEAGTASTGTASSPDAGWAADVSVRLDAMDRLGIDQTLLLPANGYLRPRGAQDTAAVNDGLSRFAALSERFLAKVGVAEPLDGPASLTELDRLRDNGFAGVSFHTRFQGVAIEHPWVARLVAHMRELRLIPFVHVYEDSTMESVLMLGELAERFADLPFIALDAAGSLAHLRQAQTAARHADNILFEVSMTPGPFLRRLADHVGPSRLVFGTDGYLDSGRLLVSSNFPAVLRHFFDHEESDAILGGNISRALRWAAAPAGPWPG